MLSMNRNHPSLDMRTGKPTIGVIASETPAFVHKADALLRVWYRLGQIMIDGIVWNGLGLSPKHHLQVKFLSDSGENSLNYGKEW